MASTLRNARVITNDLNIRSQPRLLLSAKTGRSLQYGQIVVVDTSKETTADGFVWWYHDQGGWSAARSVNNTQITMEYVATPGDNTTPTPPTPTTGSAKFRITMSGVRIRQSANSSAAVVGKLSQGDIVTVNTGTRTENNGYIWWQHEKGWSASGSVDGIQQFMEPYTTPDVGSSNILEVPWATQVDPITAPGANDCGPACIYMLLRYYNKATTGMTVKTLADLKPGLTTMQDLITIAGRYNQKLSIVNLSGTDTDTFAQGVKASLDQGKPVILLVWYALLGFQNTVAAAGLFNHWLVAVGYDDDNFIVNDPLWIASQRQGRGGSNIRISSTNLFNAYRKNALN